MIPCHYGQILDKGRHSHCR